MPTPEAYADTSAPTSTISGTADKTHSIPEADSVAYTAAYARPGPMHAGWAYFVSF